MKTIAEQRIYLDEAHELHELLTDKWVQALLEVILIVILIIIIIIIIIMIITITTIKIMIIIIITLTILTTNRYMMKQQLTYRTVWRR